MHPDSRNGRINILQMFQFLETLLALHADSFTVVAPEARTRELRMSSLSRTYHSLTSLVEKEIENKLKIPLDVFRANLFTNFVMPFQVPLP